MCTSMCPFDYLRFTIPGAPRDRNSRPLGHVPIGIYSLEPIIQVTGALSITYLGIERCSRTRGGCVEAIRSDPTS